jgi:Carboxypeptidase regulatory-like domain
VIRRLRSLIVSIFLFALGSLAFAQSAQIQGQVTDGSGAVIAKAVVRVSDQQTGTERKTESNDSGQYAVPGLNPGIYKIFVQAAGFSAAVSNPITLNVAQNAVLDFKLKIGDASSEVLVNADETGIDTTDASVSTVIDRQFVENLPMNGRSFQSLIYLTPGVSLNYGATSSDQGQFTVNGQRASANYWTVDGVGANIGMTVTNGTGNGAGGGLGGFNILGGTNSLVSVDALQEFRIETSTYAPEFGRTPGGQVAITTRSGTNQFHGTVFDYFRNTVLDSEDWFAKRVGLPKAPEQQNDFGGVLGGPIFKDKTFFFFSYEGMRLNQPYTVLATVPDLNARQIAIPAMHPYMNAYPLPTGAEVLDPSGNPTGLAYDNTTFSDPSKVDSYSLRLDHKLFSNLNIFARYSYSPSDQDSRGQAGYNVNTVVVQDINTDTATAGATWTPSAQIVNDVRYNYSQSGGKQFYVLDDFGGGTVPDLSNQFPAPFGPQNSFFGIINSALTEVWYGSGLSVHNVQHQNNVVDTLSWQKNKHSLKFGMDYRRLTPYRSDYQYAGLPIFNTLGSMERGDADGGVFLYNHLPNTYLFQNLGVFAQDTWRLNPRLTLTYGLRWDVDFTPASEGGPLIPALTGFSYTDLSHLALAPTGAAPYATPYGGFAPRIGGAYQLRPDVDHPLVLRAGFGVFYDLVSSEAGNISGYNYPFGINVNAATNQFPTPPEDVVLPPIPIPDATQGVLQGFDPHVKLPYTLEWNVALEQGLGKGQTLKISYLGSSGQRLMASELINNPNPNYLQAQIIGNGGHSQYDALQTQFQRSLSRGLQALVSYTWARSIDTGSYGAYTNGTFTNINENRGDSDFDTRNAFSAALTYIIPTTTTNPLMKTILGGWSTDNIFQANSAPPVTVNDSQFVALELTSASVSIRPDVVSGQPLYLHSSQYPGGKALNPAAFTSPPLNPAGLPTRQGNLGRNTLRAFGLTQWNFAAHKEFSIVEAVKLQFRAEMFNVLNHPNFGPYDVTFNPASPDPYFGQSTQMLGQSLVPYGIAGLGAQSPLYSVGAPRSIQLALKLMF